MSQTQTAQPNDQQNGIKKHDDQESGVKKHELFEGVTAAVRESVRQSPINISESEAVFDPALVSNPLKLEYPDKVQEKSLHLKNTGHTWKLTVGDPNFIIEGGPLFGRCQLDQIHAHWGPDSTVGSEHLIDHCAYAGEMHFVHWNTTKCKTIDVAPLHEDGLAVIGVFFKLGSPHPELQKLTDALKHIRFSGQETSLEDVAIDIRKLLPEDVTSYWTYEGSLTTPPYNDCVTWIVLKNHVEISEEQLEAMRSLVCYKEGETETDFEECGRLTKNYRPVQEQSRVNLRCGFNPGHDRC